MRHFLLITNRYKDEGLKVTGEVEGYLRARGAAADRFVSEGESLSMAAPPLGEIDPGTDCVIVLGGDGTLLRAASRLAGSGLPLIGVNLGTLGYLCELEEGRLYPALDRLLAGDCMIESRMMLSGGILGDLGEDGAKERGGRGADAAVGGSCGGSRLARDLRCAAGRERAALNDIVIHRTGRLSVVSLTVYVGGEYLNTFRADGMILSTPTGSTGYNLSAGGPIVDPKAQMILITPINAHNLNARSIVIGADDEVVVEIGRRRSQEDEAVEVSFDGDGAGRLFVGDRFCIRRAEATTDICRLSRKSFFETLGRKIQAYQ